MTSVAQLVIAAFFVATAATTNHTVTPREFGTTVTVRVGDTISIRRPTNHDRWQVDYSSAVLQLISPANARTPGPDGWEFKAIADGVTDISMTAVVPRSEGGPAAPPHFVVSIEVRAS